MLSWPESLATGVEAAATIVITSSIRSVSCLGLFLLARFTLLAYGLNK